jgi:hypothetical protein
MPTEIPLRALESQADDKLVSFCLTLLRFYILLALVLLSVTAIKMELGMYSGLTNPEETLDAIGTAAGARTTNYGCDARSVTVSGKKGGVHTPRRRWTLLE